jgi:hypothetical protein
MDCGPTLAVFEAGGNKMNRRSTLMTAALFIAVAMPAWGQSVAPGGSTQNASSIPDFSGIWSHPYVFGFELPPSGPGPVVNMLRRRQIFDPDGRPLPPANAPLVSDQTRL